MSYRNDHDAALARVDALSSENSQLAAENAKLRAGVPIVAPPAEGRVSRGVAALVLATLAGVGVLAATMIAPTHARPRAPRSSSPWKHFDRASLRTCAKELDVPLHANFRDTDPHGNHQDIGPVMRSTGCRAEIRDALDNAVISNEERAALVKWGDAEAQLDGSVSMVREYYEHDPYKLDGYSTAPQLWTEYNRALVIRNDALAEWRTTSR
jgi:hypothetical protein